MQNENIGVQKYERKGIRWLMVIYDSFFYVLCWLAVFATLPFQFENYPAHISFIYFAASYILFFGARILLKSYKRILRYGSIRSFSRELASVAAGAVCLVLLGVLMRFAFPTVAMPVTFLVVFAGV